MKKLVHIMHEKDFLSITETLSSHPRLPCSVWTKTVPGSLVTRTGQFFLLASSLCRDNGYRNQPFSRLNKKKRRQIKQEKKIHVLKIFMVFSSFPIRVLDIKFGSLEGKGAGSLR